MLGGQSDGLLLKVGVESAHQSRLRYGRGGPEGSLEAGFWILGANCTCPQRGGRKPSKPATVGLVGVL